MVNEITEIRMSESETYRKILEHRRHCPKWTKDFCMECFGGGLTIFSDKLWMESQQHD